MRKKFLLMILILSLFSAMGGGCLYGQTVTTVTNYDELNTALTADGNVVLGSDLKVDETIEIQLGKTVIIDLNGYEISTENEIYLIDNNGDLTINDGSENKSGGLVEGNETDANNDITVVVGGETVVEPIYVAKIGEEGHSTLQDAIDAVQDGETITLVADCAETVTFTQTADKSFVLDGNHNTFTGSINITARAGKDAPSTLVIKNFNFETDETSHDFIKSVETNYYPNNITITGCDFKGTSDINTEGYAVVAVRLKSANNIKIENCTGTGLHSFLQNTAGWNMTIDNVVISNSLSGFAMGTIQGTTIKNCDIAAKKFGIRLDAQYNNNAVIESNKINAFIPVVVRKASVAGTITFNGTNEFTKTNTDGIWCAIGTTEYETNGTMPTAPTGIVKVTLNDTGLNAEGIYGNFVPVAKVGEKEYDDLAEALKAVTAENNVVDILRNITINNAWDNRYTGAKFTVPVTINGNNNAIKFTNSVNDNNYQAPFRFEADATVKNLTINLSETTDTRFRAISSKGNLTVDHCEFIGKNATDNCRAIIFGEGAGANVGNLVISITNSTFTKWRRGITDNENGQDVKTVTVTGNTLTNAAVYVSAKEDVTFKNNIVENAYVNIKSYTTNNTLDVTATGNTLTENTESSYNYISARGNVDAQDEFKVQSYGTLTNAYTSGTGYWGECGGNAKESFVFKFYNDDTYMGSTSLNNVDGIIDGSVYVSWNMKLDAESNTDNYWTMSWAIRPTLVMQPNRVEQWVDYVKVAECVVEPNWSDRIFPVVAAVTDENGVILSYVNGTQGFTLQDALNAGGNIAILSDIVLTETVEVENGKTVVLDLNGKTVSMVYAKDATANHAMISNKGNLTIKSSVEEGEKGKLSYKYTGANLGTSYAVNTITSEPGSVLTVMGGTVENLTYERAVIAYAIDGLTNGGLGDVTVNIEGGVITSKRQAVRIFANSTTKTGTLNISGGELTGRVIVQNADENANKAVLEITGGTFNANDYKVDVLYVGGSNSATINIDASVSGGTFKGEITETHVKEFISGGTYATDVNEYCAYGFICTENEDGTFGIVSNPDIIDNLAELKAFRDAVNAGNTYAGKTIVLTADIDLNNEDWTPIGTSANTFNGMFDGGNHTISNLYINDSKEYVSGGNNENYVGFFGYMKGGNTAGIKNLNIKNVNITGCLYVGSVLGRSYTGGIIENCHVTGSIKIDSYSYTGGIVGRHEYSQGSNVNGDMMAIYNCSVTGDVQTRSNENTNSINADYSVSYVGGIVGFIAEGNYVIDKCSVSNVNVSGTYGVGGISGIAHYGNTLSEVSVDNVSVVSTNNHQESERTNNIGLIAGTVQGTTESPSIIEDVTITETTGSVTYTDETVKEVTDIYGTNMNGSIPVTNYEARIGVAYYETFAGALADVTDGQTITLLKNINTTERISIEKSIELDGNGLTLTYTGDDRAIDIPNNANADIDVTVKNLTVVATGANRGINYNENGEFNVENVTVTIGENVDGYAINFPGLADKAKVTIRYSKLTSRNPLNIWGENMTINVYDSEITSVDNSDVYNYAAIQLNNEIPTAGPNGSIANGTVVNVYRGKLTATDENGEPSNAVANATETGDVNISDETEVIGNVVSYVANIGGTYFATLQDAINAIEENGYNSPIVIMKSFATTESAIVKNGLNVTLNLNGKTITGTDNTSENFSLIDNRGNLTITGDGKMTLTATTDSEWSRYSAVIANNPSGKLTIENGTFEHLGGTSMAYGIDNLTNGKNTYAETVINGGTIKSAYIGVRQFLNGVEAQNIMTVKNGTIEGTNKSIWMQDPNKNANTGTLTVSENAQLKGDVYLSVTAGSTEWPVEISIAAAALKDGATVLTKNLPEGIDVQEVNGVYGVYGVVASIKTGDEIKYYQTLADAATAAPDNATIELIWAEGKAPIAMNASLYGKNVTITGTAEVDWSKGFLFVGCGGEGDATLTFDNANLTSASNNGSYGIHVSGREKETADKYDGTVEIKNSTIELDYLINKGAMTLDNSTLTVKNCFSVGGRPGGETESGVDATATMTLNNGSKVVVNNHNSMGLGYEAIGVMNIDATSTFETTQNFLVTAKGTMNVNGGSVVIPEGKTLTNNGTVYVTGASNLDATVTGDGWFYMNGVSLDADTKLLGAKVGFINGTNNIVGSTIKDGWFSVGIGNNDAATTAADFAAANAITLGDVTVNVSENAIIGGNGQSYSGWVGSAYSADKTQHSYKLNVVESLATFGYMHVSKDGAMTINGHSDNKYTYDNANVDFYAGELIINGAVTLDGTDAWSKFTKMSVDHADGVLNISNGTNFESSIHNGGNTSASLKFWKPGQVNIDATSKVEIDNETVLVEGAELNIAGDVTAKGAVTTSVGTINFTSDAATLKAQEGLTINYNLDPDKKVVYVDGVYQVVEKVYVAQIKDGNSYESLQEAINNVADGGIVKLLMDVEQVDGVIIKDKNITINLNDNTFTVTEGASTNSRNFMIDGSSVVKIENGIMVAGGDYSSGAYGTVRTEGTANVTLDDLKLYNYRGNGLNIKAMSGTTVNISNTEIYSKYGGGIEAAGGIIDIAETVKVEQKGMYTAPYNSMAVSVNGGGKITINGGTFSTECITAEEANNQGSSHGPWVVGVLNSGGTLIINGGTFSNDNFGDNSLATAARGLILADTGANIEINGGTFNALKSIIDIQNNLGDANNNPKGVITGGVYSADPTNNYVKIHEDYQVVKTGDVYTIVQIAGTQTRELVAGWSWFSTYIKQGDNGLDSLQNALNPNGVEIKSREGFTRYYSGLQDWSPSQTLTSVSTTKMYMVKTSAEHTLELAGDFENENVEITLVPGWNWIGYPLHDTIPVRNALANLTPNNGDVIKSKDQSISYVWGQWQGNMDMVPGEGYMYSSKSNTTKTFSYSTEVTGSSRSNTIVEENYWIADINKYPGNMTMIAMLSVDGEIVKDNYEIAAFANGECRGSARPIYIEALDAYVLQLTIQGEEVEELTFKYYDVNYGTEYELSNRINYSDDAIVGSIEEPYMLNLGILNIEESSIEQINIYPNPTTTNSEINLQAMCDKVEVFNALGVKVAEYSNVDSIDALETAGIYVIRVTIDGNARNCRLVVK